MLKCIDEHTIDVDLLPEVPNVLDGGCRGFGFTKKILELRPKANIISLDADPQVKDNKYKVLNYALTGRIYKRWGNLSSFEGGYANSLVLSSPEGKKVDYIQVPYITLEELMVVENIQFWDLVKLDIEGSEFEVLENWPGPIAKQITVEFHDYFNREKWNEAYFDILVKGPLRMYTPVKHELHPIGNNSLGHWDSLFILR